MPSTSLAVASSPSLEQSAMSPAATMTFPEGGTGGRSGAQPRARRPPRRTTRTIGANILPILALGGAPSRSEATAEPAEIILSNFETAISLLVRGREDSPKASSPRHRRLHTPDTTPRKQASFGYSPKCLEGEFYELRVDGVLRNSPGAMRWPSSPQPGSKLLGTRYQTVRSKQAIGETPHSESEVVPPRLFEGEARLAIDRGAARNPYLGGVATTRESSPALKTRVGRGTGIEPYDRADREERAAAA